MPLPAAKANYPTLRFTATAASVLGQPTLHGIYRVVCLPLRLAYVGQAFDLAHRCLEHQVQLREGTHTNPRLLGAYRKLGPRAFVFQVLEVYPGAWRKDCLTPLEQRWMDLHGRASLFNIRPAGSDAWLAEAEAAQAEAAQAAGRVEGADKLASGAVGRAEGADNQHELDPPRSRGADNRPPGRRRGIGTTSEKDWRNVTPPRKKRKP